MAYCGSEPMMDVRLWVWWSEGDDERAELAGGDALQRLSLARYLECYRFLYGFRVGVESCVG